MALRRAEEFRNSWKGLTETVSKQDLNIVASAFAVVVTLMPLVAPLQSPLKALISRANVGGGTRARLAALWIRRVAALLTGLYAIIGILNTVDMVLALVFFVYLYVWHLYPLIPQALGGGRPRTVQLLVLSDKASAIAPYIYDQQAAANITANGKSVITPPLSLLYITKEHYYLQSQHGLRLSLSADAVEGVVWNPR